MTAQIVLGAVLVLLGALVTWLRFSPQAKKQQEAGREIASRGTQAEDVAEVKNTKGPVVMDRGMKLWNKRTAVLGPLGIGLGLVLLLWGFFG
jgi:hypothetical protein